MRRLALAGPRELAVFLKRGSFSRYFHALLNDCGEDKKVRTSSSHIPNQVTARNSADVSSRQSCRQRRSAAAVFPAATSLVMSNISCSRWNEALLLTASTSAIPLVCSASFANSLSSLPKSGPIRSSNRAAASGLIVSLWVLLARELIHSPSFFGASQS